ncbi:hypothetical protein [Telmatospirillum siberiense]|uniref:Glucosamine inositolphosphorylceramide transferase 1 N-terminal domain-containing protein n=1 Tax=Telmatospirillum siberiense TaxID=382514 RepID=A0A2N3PUH6_9PROT|nr:hypothetical protein [Telmatospirillum siberiense]PKU24059.1 hypothetical protein CWS72_13235 [Telmatospirillum siberiense]
MTNSPLPDDPWSIGLYAGPGPLAVAPLPGLAGTVMTRDQVSDVPAAFVADPFLIRHGGLWHLFFEVLHHGRRMGEVGWAHSPDAIAWTYGGIVLREPFHLSYPCVFDHGPAVYMVPETLGAGAVRLYRANPFPARWVHVADLVKGSLADPTPFLFDGCWWMFGCPAPSSHDMLTLFCADDLFGPWHEHPASPLIVGDRTRARPAGRVVAWEGGLYRFAQDCARRYGGGVRAFSVTRLTRTAYAEEEISGSPILEASGAGWNGKGMHHIDAQPLAPGRWIAAVDGIRL